MNQAQGDNVISRILREADRSTLWIVRHRLILIFSVVYLIISAYAMLHFLHSSQLGDRYYRTKFDTMMNGTAWRPFVYRVLMPQMTWGVIGATPVSWRESFNQSWWDYVNQPEFGKIRKYMPWLAEIYYRPNIYSRMAMTVLIYLTLWGYVLALCKLSDACYPGNRAIKYLAPVFGLLSISSFSWPFQFVYDIPVLFLSAACYACMLTRRFKLYIFFFLLATLNRETSIFILIFFGIWFSNRLKPPAYIGLLTLQGVIFVVIKLLITYRYQQNPGYFLEENTVRMLGMDIFVRTNYQRIAAIVGLVLLLAYRWREKHEFLKASLWLAPLIYIGYLIHGNPGEYRVFFDLMPLLVIMGTHTVVEATGLAQASLFSNPQREASP